MSKALELAKFGRETPPTGVVVGDSDAQTLSSKTFSDGPVFSGLNANGVPFLNASKVLSSSSTFVFDGTNIGLGIASPAATLHVNASGGGTIRASRSSVGGEYIQLDHDGTDGTLRVSGNNKLYLATNGTTRVTVSGSGDVGIGTAPSTGAKLQVTGYTDFWNTTNTLLRVQHDGTRARLQAYTGGGVGDIGLNSEGGSVGIGTDSPAYKLDVNGTLNARGIQTSGTASLGFGASKWMIQQESDSSSLSYYCGPDASTYGTHFLYRATSTGSPQIVMKYSPAGNVSVGTLTSDERLTVAGNIRLYGNQAVIFQQLSGVAVGAISFRNSSGVQKAAIGSYYNIANEGAIEFVGPTNSTNMILRSTGYLGIGTTDPWVKLQVTHSVNNTNTAATNISDYQNAAIILHNQDDAGTGNKAGLFFAFAGAPGLLSGIDGYKESGNWNTGLRFYTNNQTGGASTGTLFERMRMLSSGQLVIGDTSAQYSSKLYVNGAIAARHGGVDGTYQPAFIAGYTSNYTEANVISTAVSSAAGGSGFQFEVSNGAGSAGRSSTVLFKRNQAQFNTQVSIGGNSLYFEKSGTRSWQLYANQSTGQAWLQSGDGVGNFVVDCAAVGIGTNNPGYKLHVNGTSGFNDTITQKRFTTHVWENLNGGYYPGYGVSTTARYEIARIAIDYNDWNSVGQTIIELNQIYYSIGGYSKWAVNYGYVQNSKVTLLETAGDWGGGTVSLGSPVQVSGDHYYVPVYVNVYSYHQIVARLTTTSSLAADNSTPGQGYISLFKSPNITNAGNESGLNKPTYLTTTYNHLVDGKSAVSYYAHDWQFGANKFVEIRGGKRTGTGTYTLFTRNNSDAQSSGKVYMQAIYGTPASAGTWEYCITGNKNISLTTSNTANYNGSTPSIYWSGNSLMVDNTSSSVYYTIVVELHNIGQAWDATWGDFPGIFA